MPYTPLELAEAFIKTGELEDALDALNQQLQQSPHDESAKRLRAALLLRTGDLSQALDDIKSLPQPRTEDYERLSVILERLGKLDEAITAIDSALAMQPDNERLIERALHLYLADNRYDKALQLVTQQPKTWRWLQWAGDIAARSGDSETAITNYTQAVAHLGERFNLDIDNYGRALQARLLLARAECYRRVNDLNHAGDDYLAAESIIPDDPVIPFNRGLLASAQGDFETAIALCRKALKTASDTLRQTLEVELSQPQNQQLAAMLKSDK